MCMRVELYIVFFADGTISQTHTGRLLTENVPTKLYSIAATNDTGRMCVYAYGKSYQTSKCEGYYPCAVCKIPKTQVYTLKGLSDEITGAGGAFDSKFHLDGLRDARPLFRY